jgi:hypothetical protein
MKASAAPAAHPILDLHDLGMEEGAHLLVKRALRGLAPGACLSVRGTHPHLAIHLNAWCRAQGHEFRPAEPAARARVADALGDLLVGATEAARWAGAERAGKHDPARLGAISERPRAHWGLAARGALVEAGAPEFDFALADKDELWTEEAARIYQQAAAAQWDPATAIPWDAEYRLPDEVEEAVVQVMTYLIENEAAALLVPARFLAQVHPHFREIMQLLAIQTADEARHIEIFTRRAALRREWLGLSTVGGQASLKTLIDEPDFARASFLLSVLGEGSFLNLLWFLHEHAPDPVTRAVARLAAQDEARHVAFGLAHLGRHVERDPGLRARLARAVEQRHQALKHTAGLNAEVFDALVLLSAGSWEPEAIRRGHERVIRLEREMDQGRQRRLARLGFGAQEAEALSALHTRNFM